MFVYSVLVYVRYQDLKAQFFVLSNPLCNFFIFLQRIQNASIRFEVREYSKFTRCPCCLPEHLEKLVCFKLVAGSQFLGRALLEKLVKEMFLS